MTTISAKVIAHSITEDGREISTVFTRSPLSYHPQNMTHRVFSRNAGSARAMPIGAVLQRIVADPVHPMCYLKNQAGMQGYETLDPEVAKECEAIWDLHREMTMGAVRKLSALGLHKQYANRLLVPHQHIDVLWTTVGWENFFHLRNHPDAQPEEQLFAQAVQKALEESTPQLLREGEWHLPWIRNEDWDRAFEYLGVGNSNSPASMNDVLDLLKNISASRCATLSYGNADGTASTFEKDIARVAKLQGDPLHASPFEHQATPDKKILIDRKQIIYSEIFPGAVEKTIDLGAREEWAHPELHGNLTGFIQYRKTLPNEAIVG